MKRAIKSAGTTCKTLHSPPPPPPHTHTHAHTQNNAEHFKKNVISRENLLTFFSTSRQKTSIVTLLKLMFLNILENVYNYIFDITFRKRLTYNLKLCKIILWCCLVTRWKRSPLNSRNQTYS